MNILFQGDSITDAGVGNPYIISHGFGYVESTFKKYSVYDIDCIALASWPKHEGLEWSNKTLSICCVGKMNL